MTETRQEPALSLPLLDEAATSLESSGSFHTELSADELTQIMRTIVESLLAGQDMVAAEIERLDTTIVDARCTTSAEIQISHPLTATIDPVFVLVNDIAPGRIKLESETITENAGFLARHVLEAMDLGGRVRHVLADPNQAFENALSGQLAARGARLTGVGLHFNPTTLSIDLRGGEA